MSSLPITPPAKARVDLAPKSSSPPSGSGSGDFAALLSQTSARTAPAEGQQTRPASSDQQTRRRDDDARPARRPADQDDHASADTAQATDQPKAQDGADGTDASGAETGGQPAAGQDAGAQGDPAAQGQTPEAQVAAAAAAAPAAAAQATTATAPIATPATAVTPTATPATGAASTATGAGTGTGTGLASVQDLKAGITALAAAAAAGQATGADAAAADGADAGKLQIPAELLGGKVPNKLVATKDPKNAQDGLPPAPTLPPSAGAAAAPATAGHAGDPGAGANQNGAGQPPAQPATPPAVASAQPTAAPQGLVPTAAGAPQLTRGSVVQAAERVHELVRIATTRGGNARATLQLKPEALGQVDVQLRTTRNGLVATIAAHDQAGLDALQNAANELRRTLADRGVELHSLDLQLGSGDSGFSNQGDARQASSGRGANASSYGLEDDDDVVAEDELTITTPTSTRAGALVDVTA